MTTKPRTLALIAGATLILPLVAIAKSVICKLDPVRVQDGKLVAGDRSIVLRGINWGWWHLWGTRYAEDDMRRQAEWGANVLRFPVSCKDFEDPKRPGFLREDGIRDVDEVLGWAEKYGQYVILDMHGCPLPQGGFDRYRDGHRRGIWTDRTAQLRYLSLWSELAKRYRARNVVAGYELMNEPDTQQPTPDEMTRLFREAIATIREVDASKMIVVTGDRVSDARSLTGANILPDDNLLYTFHFYDCGGYVGGWLRNEGNGVARRGTCDWSHFDVTMKLTARDSALAVLLRSTDNAGTAWFDDVEIVDSQGKTVASYAFDADTNGFAPERGTPGTMTYDKTVGHARPGSLRVSGTRSYNGWSGPHVKLPQREATYRLRGWMRLEKATGDTYAAGAMFGVSLSTPEKLAGAIAPAAAFRRKYNVPVLVGEFAIERGTNGQQPLDTAWRIELFEKFGFHWTYWNYRETTNPETMALQAQRGDGTDFPINEPLLSALKAGWRKNGCGATD